MVKVEQVVMAVEVGVVSIFLQSCHLLSCSIVIDGKATSVDAGVACRRFSKQPLTILALVHVG